MIGLALPLDLSLAETVAQYCLDFSDVSWLYVFTAPTEFLDGLRDYENCQ